MSVEVRMFRPGHGRSINQLWQWEKFKHDVFVKLEDIGAVKFATEKLQHYEEQLFEKHPSLREERRIAFFTAGGAENSCVITFNTIFAVVSMYTIDCNESFQMFIDEMIAKYIDRKYHMIIMLDTITTPDRQGFVNSMEAIGFELRGSKLIK